MISFLEGIVDTVRVDCLALNVQGIGYQINTPSYNNLSLKAGDKIKIYTYLYLREDKIMLYGFTSEKMSHVIFHMRQMLEVQKHLN